MTKKWKVVLLLFFSVILTLVAASAFLKMQTKKHSPVDTVTFEKGDLNINMVYYRPFKKGRIIFGSADDGALQPYGTYWRLGANDATTIEVNRDVDFAGKPLKAGKYSVYAYPGEKEWKIGVNSKANRWGVSEPDHENDVLTVMVPVTYSDEIIEQFEITLEPTEQGAEMVLKWDTSVVKISID
jgi:Protein of unknown function (DUF2911)